MVKLSYLLASIYAIISAADTVTVPGGHQIHQDCVLQVENSALVDEAIVRQLQNCKPAPTGMLGFGTEQIYAQDIHR